MSIPIIDPRDLLLSLFDAAVEAAQPARCLPPFLPAPPKGKTIIVGAGKAAASMAAVVEGHWTGPISGLVVTRYGHGVPCRSVEVVEAGHPVPDEAGFEAARRMVELVEGLSPDDLVLCLLSGGGSALLTMPAPGVPLADKQAVTRALLACGADIHEINTVRKHLSAIKGGRLAVACAPATVHTLAISDVVGDDLAVIASGPTTPDPTTFDDARAIFRKYAIDVPHSVDGYFNRAEETPKPGDPRLPRLHSAVIANGTIALEAAREKAETLGIPTQILSDAMTGEARTVAREVANRIAGGPSTRTQNGAELLLGGGELTVTVAGDGEGGPNGEFLLALALELGGRSGIHAISCDTDGIDGSGDCAGALIGPDTLARADALGLDPKSALARNDSYGVFKALGDQIATGPTKTNVNDFRAILSIFDQ